MTSIVKLTPEQEVTLQAWRAVAIEKMPYMTATLFSLRCVNAPGLGTFAVDAGHRLYIDFDSVTDRGMVWCSEALLHEASHVLQRHDLLVDELGVPEEMMRTLNAACDCAINDDLVEAGFKSFETDGIIPSKIGEPDNLTPHHYYNALKAKQDAAKKNQPKPQPGSGQQGQGGNGGQPGESGSNGSVDGKVSNGSGNGEPYKGCGSGGGGAAAPCELDPTDDFNGEAPAANSVEKERNQIATAAAIREHGAKGIGKIPGGLVEWAEQVLAPTKTPWQQVLASMMRRTVASRSGNFDADPSRRNRRRHRVVVNSDRGHALGHLIVPGTYTPVPQIAVIRDTSGSMGADDLLTVSNEVAAIAKKMGIRGNDLRIIDVDTEAHEARGYQGARTMATVQGRGGTDMRVGIQALAQQRKHRPTIIVVLTDGGTPWPDEAVGIPVVAAIIDRDGSLESSEDMAPPSWIKTVYVGLDDKVA